MNDARAVAARFYISRFSRSAYANGGGQVTEVDMNAVSRGEHNKNWAKWTPNAQVKLTFGKPDHNDPGYLTQRLGKEMAVLFTEDESLLPEGGVRVRMEVAGYEKYAGQNGVVNVKLRSTAAWGNPDGIPTGEITMTIANPGAAAWFTEGLEREVIISFTEAEPGD